MLRFVKIAGASMVRGSVASSVGGRWSGEGWWRGKRGDIAKSSGNNRLTDSNQQRRSSGGIRRQYSNNDVG